MSARRRQPAPAPAGTSHQLSILEKLEGSTAAEILGGRFGSRVRMTFRLMEVGEELLAKRWPGKRREPRAAFKLLYPTQPVRISEMLYRAHAAEMIDRMTDDELNRTSLNQLELLTRAEVVGLLVEASLRHPLGHHDACVYEHLFTELFPAAPLPGDRLLHGASATLLEEVRRTRGEWLIRSSPERAAEIAEMRKTARAI